MGKNFCDNRQQKGKSFVFIYSCCINEIEMKYPKEYILKKKNTLQIFRLTKYTLVTEFDHVVGNVIIVK